MLQQYVGVDWVHVAQGGVQLSALVNMVMKTGLYEKWGIPDNMFDCQFHKKDLTSSDSSVNVCDVYIWKYVANETWWGDCKWRQEALVGCFTEKSLICCTEQRVDSDQALHRTRGIPRQD
jgi:hypothetical protein